MTRTERRMLAQVVRKAAELGAARERQSLFALVSKSAPTEEPTVPDPTESTSDSPHPHVPAAMALAMLDHVIECNEWGDDPQPGLDALRGLLDDPRELARVGGLSRVVTKAVYFAGWSKAMDLTGKKEGDTWQGPSGRWFVLRSGRPVPSKNPNAVDQGGQKEPSSRAYQGATGSVARAAKEIVGKGGGKDDPNVTPSPSTLEGKERRELAAKRAVEIGHKASSPKGKLTHADLHELATHLPHLTGYQLKKLREHLQAGIGGHYGAFGGRRDVSGRSKAFADHLMKLRGKLADYARTATSVAKSKGGKSASSKVAVPVKEAAPVDKPAGKVAEPAASVAQPVESEVQAKAEPEEAVPDSAAKAEPEAEEQASPSTATQPAVASRDWKSHPVARAVADSLRGATGLSPEQRAEYGRAMGRVLSRMPAKAHDALARGLRGGVRFHGDKQDMARALVEYAEGMAESLKGQPGKDEMYRSWATAARGLARAAKDPQALGGLGGMYRPDTRAVHVNGGVAPTAFGGDFGGEAASAAHHVYAHELGHAIDEPRFDTGTGEPVGTHSGTPEWRAVMREEIAPHGSAHTDHTGAYSGSYPLTDYATTDDTEGFAEFARLVYSGDYDHAEVERKFPKAAAYFRKNGLWPEHGGNPGGGADLSDLFDRETRIDLPNGHVDTIKPDGRHNSEKPASSKVAAPAASVSQSAEPEVQAKAESEKAVPESAAKAEPAAEEPATTSTATQPAVEKPAVAKPPVLKQVTPKGEPVPGDDVGKQASAERGALPPALHALAEAAHAGPEELDSVAGKAKAAANRSASAGGDLATHDAIEAAMRGEHGSVAKEVVGRATAWENHEGDTAKKYAAVGRELAKAGFAVPTPKQGSGKSAEPVQQAEEPAVVAAKTAAVPASEEKRSPVAPASTNPPVPSQPAPKGKPTPKAAPAAKASPNRPPVPTRKLGSAPPGVYEAEAAAGKSVVSGSTSTQPATTSEAAASREAAPSTAKQAVTPPQSPATQPRPDTALGKTNAAVAAAAKQATTPAQSPVAPAAAKKVKQPLPAPEADFDMGEEPAAEVPVPGPRPQAQPAPEPPPSEPEDEFAYQTEDPNSGTHSKRRTAALARAVSSGRPASTLRRHLMGAKAKDVMEAGRLLGIDPSGHTAESMVAAMHEIRASKEMAKSSQSASPVDPSVPWEVVPDNEIDPNAKPAIVGKPVSQKPTWDADDAERVLGDSDKAVERQAGVKQPSALSEPVPGGANVGGRDEHAAARGRHLAALNAMRNKLSPKKRAAVEAELRGAKTPDQMARAFKMNGLEPPTPLARRHAASEESKRAANPNTAALAGQKPPAQPTPATALGKTNAAVAAAASKKPAYEVVPENEIDPNAKPAIVGKPAVPAGGKAAVPDWAKQAQQPPVAPASAQPPARKVIRPRSVELDTNPQKPTTGGMLGDKVGSGGEQPYKPPTSGQPSPGASAGETPKPKSPKQPGVAAKPTTPVGGGKAPAPDWAKKPPVPQQPAPKGQPVSSDGVGQSVVSGSTSSQSQKTSNAAASREAGTPAKTGEEIKTGMSGAPGGFGGAAADKAKEYAGRIRGGHDRASVMQGQGPVMRAAVARELGEPVHPSDAWAAGLPPDQQASVNRAVNMAYAGTPIPVPAWAAGDPVATAHYKHLVATAMAEFEEATGLDPGDKPPAKPVSTSQQPAKAVTPGISPKPQPASSHASPSSGPSGSRPAVHSAAHGRLREAVDKSPGLSNEQRAKYHAGVDRVAGAMPKAAHDRVGRHMKGAKFHPDTQSLGGALEKDMSPKARAAFAAGKFGNPGAYNRSTGELHADGDITDGVDRHSRGDGLAHHTYAHELGHAIDGPDHELSKSAAWQTAHGSEIDHPSNPLTKYARKSASEGFAEFARLVYASDVPHAQIEKEFPKAAAFYKKHGLWPEKDRRGDAGKMPEAFDTQVPLADGSHVDVKASASRDDIEFAASGEDKLGEESELPEDAISRHTEAIDNHRGELVGQQVRWRKAFKDIPDDDIPEEPDWDASHIDTEPFDNAFNEEISPHDRAESLSGMAMEYKGHAERVGESVDEAIRNHGSQARVRRDQAKQENDAMMETYRDQMRRLENDESDESTEAYENLDNLMTDVSNDEGNFDSPGEHAEALENHTDILRAMLAHHQEQVDRVTGRPGRVSDSPRGVTKAWDESKHPQDHGNFASHTGHAGVDVAIHEHAHAPTARSKEALEVALWNIGVENPAKPPKELDADEKLIARRLASEWSALQESGGTQEELAPLERAMKAHGMHSIGSESHGSFDGRYHAGIPGVFTGDKVRFARPGWVKPLDGGREYVVLKAGVAKG